MYTITVPPYRPPGQEKTRLTVSERYFYLCDKVEPWSEQGRDRPFDYSYSVPTDLHGPEMYFSNMPAYCAAGYVIDGQRFAVAVAKIPGCDQTWYENLSEQVAYLEHPNQGSGDGWGHWLLWNDEEPSAAVTTFEGVGDLTGNEVLRVTLNYCDWEWDQRVSMKFAIIGLDPGTTISADARTCLLGVVSDVAESIERT